MYTLEMQKALRSVKPPHEFVIDIVEYDLDPKMPFLAVRFYESKWNYNTEKERLDCVSYLAIISKILTSF